MLILQFVHRRDHLRDIDLNPDRSHHNHSGLCLFVALSDDSLSHLGTSSGESDEIG